MKTFVLIDIQNDFTPGGALPVPKGNEVVSFVNQMMPRFDRIVATKDWHPKNHVSFASNHPRKKIGEVINVQDGTQILWPDHCVQGSHGAEFAKGLHTDQIEEIFRKGTNPKVDSYSAFFDQSRHHSTGLQEFLQKSKLTDLYFAGLATDYCVLYSVLDALQLGFRVTVLVDGCRAINMHPGDEASAIKKMADAGAIIR
jgi:nicotinamidase/pyrazinamidase